MKEIGFLRAISFHAACLLEARVRGVGTGLKFESLKSGGEKGVEAALNVSRDPIYWTIGSLSGTGLIDPSDYDGHSGGDFVGWPSAPGRNLLPLPLKPLLLSKPLASLCHARWREVTWVEATPL
jgi:hypothetical protein